MRYLRGAAVLLAALIVTGCAAPQPQPEPEPEPEPERDVHSYIGSSVEQAEQSLPPDTTYVVYDVSLPVTGKDPRYGTADGGTNRDWIIVAACGTPRELAVGVLHVEDHSRDVAATARGSGFDDLLAECRND